jgi:hypothetical protein
MPANLFATNSSLSSEIAAQALEAGMLTLATQLRVSAFAAD